MILAGELTAGQKLPSSRTLSKELGIARNTVLEAYEQLLAEGYLDTRHGSGTRVAKGIVPMRDDSAPATQCHPNESRRNLKNDTHIITFRSGITDLKSFPKQEWGRLYNRTCEALPASAFRYCGPDGVWELRKTLASYLFRGRGIRVAPDRIMVTSGATQGLWLVARLLRAQGNTVLVEDPMHRGLIEVLARTGYTITGVRADAWGMETAQLAWLSQGEHIAFTYVTPSHQYPLGGVLPIQRRQEIIQFAQSSGSMIVEDDYDSEFRYEGSPVSSLFELAPETVIYLGSFSKILAPALRLGFAIVPESMLETWQAEKMYTDVHTDALTQHTLAAFITSGGLERHIWKMRKLYKQKRAHLTQELRRLLGNGFEIMGDAAGLHMVAAFKGITFTSRVVDELYARGVKVIPVEQHSLCKDGTHANEIILGYSHLSTAEMTQAITILKQVIDYSRA